MIRNAFVVVVGVSCACFGRADHELTDCWPACRGIWISRAEIMQLPTSGPAWDELRRYADMDGVPDLSDIDSNADVLTLAKAFVYVRTGDETYRGRVRDACLAAIDTELAGTALNLGRGLAAYVISAELVGLEPSEDERFRAWLRRTLDEQLSQAWTLRTAHESRPNVWGTMAGASRIAVAAYLDDADELEQAALVFEGFLGNRAAWDSFEFGAGAETWSPFPADDLVAINPSGATVGGVSVGGAVIDEMRQGGSFAVPPVFTREPLEALGGALMQAEMLHRRGYSAYQWQDEALLRAYEFLLSLHQQYGQWFDDATVTGDDRWQTWMVNRRYGTDLPRASAAGFGKPMGWTDWTHGS
ncbi:MAG: alginate lyase family protein, partial [Deltaproteobacteria bacterium]|nr:alginate lyase family protein [Deltaproteobacteria bacterium]